MFNVDLQDYNLLFKKKKEKRQLDDLSMWSANDVYFIEEIHEQKCPASRK